MAVKRSRSPEYPSFSLREVIEKVRRLHEEIGRNPTSREVVAQGMGYRGLSGASASAIGAARKYGLLEGRGDDICVSDLAMAILHPHDELERRQALREAATSPELFRELAQKFPDQRVSDELLKNYLLRNGFSPSALPSLISAYKDTIELGTVNSGDYESDNRHEDESEPMDAKVPPDLHHMRQRTSRTGPKDEPVLNDINATITGRLVRIDVLLDANGLKKLKKRIDALMMLIEDEGDPTNAPGETD